MIGSGTLPDTTEQADLREMVREIIERFAPPQRVRELDDANAFDLELYRALGEAGLIGLDAQADGTSGADPRLQIIVLEELAAGPTSMAVCLVVQYMGVGLLTEYGSDQQRSTVLAPLLDGSERVAFALTEPDGGTDVARVMRTRAKKSDDGRWILNGAKTWISGPQHARNLIVLARTSTPESSPIDGITMFVVPTDTPGITVRELDTFAIHSLDTCEVTFDNVEIDASAVLGHVDQGFRQVLGTLNGERLNAAAAALGIARGALEAAVDYGRQRQVFGRPVGSFQAGQHRLVDGAIAIESARALMLQAAEATATGKRADILSAMAKVAASDAAVAVTDAGMRLMGGSGFSKEYPMERLFRDARLYTFAPLTNEMLRNHIGEKYLGLPRSF
ncbi:MULTISPECIES: acyl-CoA dehydrogenase family protein [Rhodococcus]|uniref:acyl-CoA dehydrogenase family protein n=1 Tax=Rhodococcus TaxID=1827 RepID=UPI0002FB2203|nr:MULTISPECIES: acyl-CoA dehydrogenase family protein [Rhodococcus]KXF48739.1 acyl-CoA dehydrogenase [Rhodococcus sp. SC4]AHK34285.1 putative acyl-CoA dehydrogenase YngJ [Rhodococcus opacus PD630]MDV7085938.1 acyl-CoA dehydrogenase family protein [Rhodococcus opacus]PBC56528.1 acyl-CoA dehydrogenase [Rhodococcus sp. ACPA1]UDG96467.1 acyl-CoA/acyl-ACP dehydrogenase [Rhodococcus opacus PD630]